MEIVTYTMAGGTNKIEKTLSDPHNYTSAMIKDESNVVNPTIYLSKDIATADFNYFYIDTFGRYYYVTDKRTNHGMIEIDGHVDVLYTYRSDIKNMHIVAERSSKGYNLYQIDPELPNKNYKTITTKKFPGSFDGYTYILAVNG